MTDRIWVLGATGRSGRGVAEQLHKRGHRLVLAGRDPARLQAVASGLDNVEIASGSLDTVLARWRNEPPTVVVNTVGPFAQTTEQVLAALPAGSHYVDIANELPAVVDALAQHEAAVRDGSTIVTGSGFGVLATESLVVAMCARRPQPTQVRVDAIASLAVEAGVIGEALAGSILDGLPDGGREISGGRLVRSGVAGRPVRLTTPDGDASTTATLPSGELIAAWRASTAPTVIAATSAIPSGIAVRAALPLLTLLSRVHPLRRWGVKRLAAVPMRAAEMPRQHSWGHCTMEWADGTRREGWLQLPDAQAFTIAATAEVAHRLAAGTTAVGAYTPAALFGAALATDLGGVYLL